jgi:Flp pilus assembly protein TadD
MAERRNAALAGAAVGALALLAYANTLGHGFVWDDPISLERWLPALPTAGSAFFPPPNIPQFPSDYYRPLQLLSYRLDRAIGGGAPWAFHLNVVLAHGLATVLVFVAGLRLFERSPAGRGAALAAALLFAVHPIHTESVAWMAARPDVMVACLGLAALLAYWRTDWSDERRSIVAAGLIFAALLCKENAAALLVLVPLSAWVLGQPRTGARGRQARRRADTGAAPRSAELLPFAAAVLLYLLLRLLALGRVLPAPAAGRASLLLALVSAAGAYLRLLVVPHPQNAYITELPVGGATLAGNLLAVVAFLLLLAWAWRRSDRVLSFALAWIGLTLAPSLALVAEGGGAPLAERYLYVPSIGFCWAAGALLARAYEQSRGIRLAASASVGVLVLAGLAMTVQRNRVWRDNLRLWSDTAVKNTTDGLPLRNLATATLAAGDPIAAQRLFHDALGRRNDPYGQYTIHNNLGTIALNRGDDVAAERHYRTAFTLQPTADCAYNIGLIALRRGLGSEPTPDAAVRSAKLREARDLLEQAVAASPHDSDIHVALGQAADALGDQPAARRHFAEALRLGLPPSTEAAVRRLMERP